MGENVSIFLSKISDNYCFSYGDRIKQHINELGAASVMQFPVYFENCAIYFIVFYLTHYKEESYERIFSIREEVILQFSTEF